MIKLAGALDVIGTDEIEAKFSRYCSGNKVRVVVDLSELDFLASIGIRLLTLTAKSVASRGGRLALVGGSGVAGHIGFISSTGERGAEILRVLYLMQRTSQRFSLQNEIGSLKPSGR